MGTKCLKYSFVFLMIAVGSTVVSFLMLIICTISLVSDSILQTRINFVHLQKIDFQLNEYCLPIYIITISIYSSEDSNFSILCMRILIIFGEFLSYIAKPCVIFFTILSTLQIPIICLLNNEVFLVCKHRTFLCTCFSLTQTKLYCGQILQNYSSLITLLAYLLCIK